MACIHTEYGYLYPYKKMCVEVCVCVCACAHLELTLYNADQRRDRGGGAVGSRRGPKSPFPHLAKHLCAYFNFMSGLFLPF